MSDHVIAFLTPARAAKSGLLDALHRDGFALIESAYGLLNDKNFVPGNLAEPTVLTEECNRLNTRLMIMASWLLLQRSLCEDDLSEDEPRKELPQLAAFAAHAPTVEPEVLPEPIRGFVIRSIDLQERLTRIDAMLYRAEAA